MIAGTERDAERVADFMLPGGCLSCGGDVTVRASAAGTRGYCPRCRWLSKPLVRLSRDGLEIAYAAAAEA